MSQDSEKNSQKQTFKQRMWEIVFEAETPAGKVFDVVLLWAIVLSVLAVMLESVGWIEVKYGELLLWAEWFFTIMFSIEYLMRLWLSRRPLRYATSFYGIVDLLSCIPTYLTLIPALAGSKSFLIIRVLRLLRMFRVLKMVHHVRGANVIMRGLIASKPKITVFFFCVLLLSVLAGTLMYLVESGEPKTKFTSIPQSIYYAVVSITTVGYGDITAQTPLGQFLTTIMILTGYAIIAVPTGIVTSEMVKAEQDETTDACPGCGAHGHLHDAKFCRKCGHALEYHPEPEPGSK